MKSHIQQLDIKRRQYQYHLRQSMRRLRSDNRGLGTIEIVIILAILVGLALLFKGFVVGLFDNFQEQISNDAGSILEKN
jgi:cell division protein ZapA (FtsZ GTPase activity inhibitor)